ncbi:MAG: DUF2799 domain-containing protein [Candidatus Thiodiazotropha sp. (ex Lucinoma borealis)]|nr:DUF2799 domain-containing protein [Candidatus Thiodiazotropha sp. (ex Lucinoma borealis)]MCU7857524.1 DUF2799 domain-containing protein [Candidatus Thiodiazotropha sp. (ex Lucinoma borealis)]MCU7869383.1 DUF2799 domain-containing protein [Candidatus Thiodiazotropha sp. (ex Lucinoma borealis)]
MIRYFVFTAAVFVLSGCASMDKEECQIADWQTIGYEDGAKGRALSYLGNHRKACSDYGISPDMEHYEQGRLAGLHEYCTPSNGFELGKSGQKFNTVCKPPLAEDFKLAWSQGFEVHDALSQLRNSERTLKQYQKKAATLHEQIEDAEAELVSDGISSKKRKALLAEIKDLNAELEDAESELLELQDRVLDDRDYLEQVEARYHY